jgi:Ca-activated chloride channel family protein
MFAGDHPIPLTGVEMQAQIIGRGARVKVIQNFLNVEDKAIEAIYKFPLPEGAAICGFRALIDDRIVIGEIEDRETAFALYDKALTKGDGAYLLDEERPNIFTLSVGNLPPGKKAAIELEYATLIETNGRETRFFLPTTISPRYVPVDMPEQEGIPIKEIINPPFQLQVPYGLSISITVHGADQIESIQSPSHPINIAFPQEGTGSPDHNIIVTFAGEKAAMDRDFILTVLYRQAFSNRACWCRYQDDIFIQVDLCENAGENLKNVDEATKTESREIVFVLDCSGSMEGSSIGQARKAIDILLKALPQDTLFNIYRFGSTYEKIFPTCVPYIEENLKAALSYVADINADLGGTEIFEPLKDLYKSPPARGSKRHIILITDGEIANEDQIIKLIKTGVGHTVLHSVGIGYGSNEYLISQAARTAGGACEFVAPGERIEPKVLRLFEKIASCSVRDIHVYLDSDIDQAPAHPFLLQGEAVTILLKTSEGSFLPEKLTVSGTTGKGDRHWEIPMLGASGNDMPIPVLWAKEKIRDIEEFADTEEGSRQLERKKEQRTKNIIAISRKYGVISRETSYVAVEKRPPANAEDQEIVLRKVPVMLTKDWGGIPIESGESCRICQPAGVFASLNRPAFFSIVKQALFMPFSPSTRDEDDADLEIPTFLRRESSVSTSSISSSAVNEEELITILSCQQSQGGFIWSKELAEMFGLSREYLCEMAEKIAVTANCDKYMLFYTMLTIELLERKFSNDKSSWRAIVEKSMSWLNAELQRCQPSIDGLDLESWIRERYYDLTER